MNPFTRTPALPASGFALGVRVIVYALTALVWALPLTQGAPLYAACAAAAIGAVAGRLLAHRTLRLWVIFFSALLGVACVYLLHVWALSSDDIVRSLGPLNALLTIDSFFSFTSVFILSTALRSGAARHRLWSFGEISVVALGFAQLVAAHRYGTFTQPRMLVDPLLSRGIDPALAYLGVGVIATLAITLLTINDPSLVRTLAQLVLIVMILIYVLPSMSVPEGRKDDQQLSMRNPQLIEEGRGSGAKSDQNNSQDQNKSQNQNKQKSPPVAVVLLHDDYTPPSGNFYFRQNALSQFNGRRLVQTTRSDVDQDIALYFPSSDLELKQGPPINESRQVLETTVALLADHPQPFALESALSIYPLKNGDPLRFRRMFRVRSAALNEPFLSLIGHDAGSSTWSQDQRQYYLKLPEDTRYRSLANEIRSQLPFYLQDDPLAQALAISRYLSDVGTYSLRHKHENAQDATADFLFGDKTGYCVHFAHSVAYLLRALGLPARVGTGYAISESARQGGSSILLSDHDAHAWAELYLQDVGWVVIDVSPKKILDPPPPPPDPDLQRLLGQMARGERLSPFTEPIDLPKVNALTRTFIKNVLLGLAGIVAFSVVVLYLIRVWRRIAPHFASDRRLIATLYRRELDMLSAYAARRVHGETPSDFSKRLATHTPSFAKIAALYTQACFGKVNIDESLRKDLWQNARRIERELAHSHSLWQRLIGALDPFNWLRSR